MANVTSVAATQAGGGRIAGTLVFKSQNGRVSRRIAGRGMQVWVQAPGCNFLPMASVLPALQWVFKLSYTGGSRQTHSLAPQWTLVATASNRAGSSTSLPVLFTFPVR